MDYEIMIKLYAHSNDGKRTDAVYRTQKGFERDNSIVLEQIYLVPKDVPVELQFNAGIGETEVDGNEPFIYSREKDEQDRRLEKAINFAINDLRDAESSLYRCVYLKSCGSEGDSKESFVKFALKLIEAIIRDGGSGAGGNDLNGLTKLVAKVYTPYANRYLDYGDYINYFSFYVDPEVLRDEIEALDPQNGYFMLDSKIVEIDLDTIINRIVPAMYYSLNFIRYINGSVRNLELYSLELG